jgi:hypothetical protein
MGMTCCRHPSSAWSPGWIRPRACIPVCGCLGPWTTWWWRKASTPEAPALGSASLRGALPRGQSRSNQQKHPWVWICRSLCRRETMITRCLVVPDRSLFNPPSQRGGEIYNKQNCRGFLFSDLLTFKYKDNRLCKCAWKFPLIFVNIVTWAVSLVIAASERLLYLSCDVARSYRRKGNMTWT